MDFRLQGICGWAIYNVHPNKHYFSNLKIKTESEEPRNRTSFDARSFPKWKRVRCIRGLWNRWNSVRLSVCLVGYIETCKSRRAIIDPTMPHELFRDLWEGRNSSTIEGERWIAVAHQLMARTGTEVYLSLSLSLCVYLLDYSYSTWYYYASYMFSNRIYLHTMANKYIYQICKMYVHYHECFFPTVNALAQMYLDAHTNALRICTLYNIHSSVYLSI